MLPLRKLYRPETSTESSGPAHFAQRGYKLRSHDELEVPRGLFGLVLIGIRQGGPPARRPVGVPFLGRVAERGDHVHGEGSVLQIRRVVVFVLRGGGQLRRRDRRVRGTALGAQHRKVGVGQILVPDGQQGRFELFSRGDGFGTGSDHDIPFVGGRFIRYVLFEPAERFDRLGQLVVHHHLQVPRGRLGLQLDAEGTTVKGVVALAGPFEVDPKRFADHGP
jgi:hypothetical protein